MAATDATPIPVKNQAYRVTFPILDADGDLVSGATALDTEVSKDAGAFTDCTNEATEIATTSGMYYLDLTATEMNADTVALIVKTTTSGAKTTPMVLYPNKSGGLAVNVTSWAGNAVTTGDIAIKTTLAKGTHITGFNDVSTAQVNTEADTALADVGLTSTVTGRIDATVSSRATPAQVQTELVTYNAAKPGAAMTLTSAYDPAKTAASQTSVNTIDGRLDTEIPAIKSVTDKLDTALVIDGPVYQYTANALELGPVGGGGGGTGDAMQATLLEVKAKTDNLPADPADASDIANSFNNINTKIDTVNAAVDTEIPAIKAKTDQLSFTGGKVDANVELADISPDNLTAIADAILKRDWTALTGESAYSLLNAARMLRNVWNTAGGTLTVHKEDGTSVAWSRVLATDPNADPIIGAT